MERLKEEFQLPAQRIQHGPLGMWRRQVYSHAAQLTTHSGVVALDALGNRSDATQFAALCASIAAAAVQPTLGSYLALAQTEPKTRQGCWWLPEMRAARQYTANRPTPAQGTDDSFNMLCQRLKHSEITEKRALNKRVASRKEVESVNGREGMKDSGATQDATIPKHV